MARVEIATEGWGYIVDTRGRPLPDQLCAIDTTVYAAATGASTVAAPDFKSDSEGLLPGWLEPGRYTFTEPDSETRTVIAGGGYQTMMDESSVMAKRDTLKFEGSAVELQDDSANDRTRVIVTGSPGATGPPGEIFGVDVWNEQATPASVTDWGPTINSLVAAGAKLLLFRDEVFPYSTQLLLNQSHVTFQAMAGASGITTDNPTFLTWKGSGSGTAINVAGSDALTLSGLRLMFDNAGFTGSLIKGAANSLLVDGCQLSSEDHDTRPAFALLHLDNCVNAIVRGCNIAGGADWGIFGMTSGAGVSDNIRIEDCWFNNHDIAHIGNIGNWWDIHGNVFTFGSFGGFSTPAAIGSDGTSLTSKFSFHANWLWDYAGSARGFNQLVTNPWYATITGCLLQSVSDPPEFVLDGSGSVAIEYNYFERALTSGGDPYVDVGSSATALKEYFSFRYNHVSASNNPSSLVSNQAGHRHVEIGPNGDGGGTTVDQQQQRVVGGHERAMWNTRYQTAVTLAAGQPAITIYAGRAHDLFGFVGFETPGGSASVAGHLATFTFGTAMDPGIGGGLTSADRIPVVTLSVFNTSDAGANMNASYDCGFMAKVTSSQQAAWQLHTRNAIPSGTKVMVAYRIAAQL